MTRPFFAILIAVSALVAGSGCGREAALRFAGDDTAEVILLKDGREVLLERVGLRLILVRDRVHLPGGESLPGDSTIELRLVNVSEGPLHLNHESVLLYVTRENHDASQPSSGMRKSWLWPEGTLAEPVMLLPGEAVDKRFVLPGGFDVYQRGYWVLCRSEAPLLEGKALLRLDPGSDRLVPMELFPSYRHMLFGPSPSWARNGFPY